MNLPVNQSIITKYDNASHGACAIIGGRGLECDELTFIRVKDKTPYTNRTWLSKIALGWPFR